MKVKIIRNKERAEIYNALCFLNIGIRDKQPERAKYIRKLIKKYE